MKMNHLIIFIGILMFSTNIFGSEETKFWKWFIKNKSALELVKSSDEPILNKLSEKLKSYNQDLVYEISLHTADVREIIINGDGIRDMIPVVLKLTKAAPNISGWEIIAFRPRMKDYMGFNIDYEGESFDPKNIWFYPITNEGYFDIILYHPDYKEENKNKFIGGTYIMLDMALGEYDVMTKIRYIDHQKLPSDPQSEGLKPFSELRHIFDDFHKANETIH